MEPFNCELVVADMIEKFKNIDCLKNLKLDFLHNHLGSFPENLVDVSEEQGE